MTAEFIILFSGILLLAYLLDLSSKITRIPTVIWLLVIGITLKQFTTSFGLQAPSLHYILPVFGTIGLILIVLEGALDLKLSKKTIPVIKGALLMSFIPFAIFTACISVVLVITFSVSWQVAFINVIPFAIISSAIAIPSVKIFNAQIREFITYESSISDIIGVLCFNFFLTQDVIDSSSIWLFFIQLIIVSISSVVLSIMLSFLLSRMSHHVKYGPILLLILFVYGLSKYWHLPGLIFILIFGLTLSNLHLFKDLKLAKYFKPDKIPHEIKQFSYLVTEATFLIRSLFFVLFGFMIDLNNLLNFNTLPWSLSITGLLFVLRLIFLKLTKQSILPQLFIAPRGLITILLFLSIPTNFKINLVNQSLVIQVILLSILIMMMGIISHREEKGQPENL